MPFRRAYLVILLLVPMIAVAFWPGYFALGRSAPFALHAHGLSAMAWLGLLWFQSWTAHRRLSLHRLSGLAIFAAVPLFVMGGLLAMQGMAALAAAKADPFHAHYGARLALDDALAIGAFLTLVTFAVARRRKVWLHGGAMLGTALLVLPPIVTRLPVFPDSATFVTVFLIAQGCALAGAAALAAIYPRARAPFGFVAGTIAVQTLLVQTFGVSGAWERICFGLIAVPSLALAVVGLVLGAVPLWLAWRRPVGPRPAPLGAGA
jgi:hypothetical protein